MLINRIHQFRATLMVQRGDLEDGTFPGETLEEVLHQLFTVFFRHHVELVQHQPARLVDQRLVVFLQFLDQRLGFLDRIDVGFKRRQVDDVQQQTRALQVTQELMAQARAFGSAFDQAGNIGDHKALLVRHAHHAQVRVQGGKWVIGNFRARVRDGRNEGRLAGVRHAQQAHVGQYLQFQAQFAAFAFLALTFLAWRAVGRGLEVDIAPAAFAALGQHFGLAVFGQIGQDFAARVVDDQGADRHAQVDVIGALAIAICATARLAIASLVHFGEAEIDERVDIAVGDCPNGAALAAIAAIGTAERPEFFTAERGAAVAAIARDDFDFCFVDKLHNFAAIKLKRLYLGQSLSIEGLRLTSCDHGGANWRPAMNYAGTAALGTTVTNCFEPAPLTTNFTLPAISANKVWSLPMPTPSPARTGVPR